MITVSGAALERGTVVLREGLIEAVGASAAVPPDARLIEAEGLTLTPGLIDAFGGVGLPPRRRPSELPPESPSPPPETVLAPHMLALEQVRVTEALKARDDGVTTVLVVPEEGVLPGRSVLLNLSGDKAEGMVLKQPAALHVHLTTLSRQYPTSLMGTIALVRQALLDAGRYRQEWAAYEKSPLGRKRPRYDRALEAWADVVSGRLPLILMASRENDVRRALALADEFKVKVVVAGSRQAAQVADLIKARRLPLLVSVNFDPARLVASSDDDGEDDEEKERREIEEAEGNPAALHKAGVSFALVSGHAPRFLAGIQKAMEKGLPPEAALRAVTLGAAEALGLADRTGSIERGKMANLVAWAGEPLAKEARVKMVFVDGQLYEPEPRPEPSPPADRP